MDLTTPDWIMQSSDCLRRYWLSTAYLMLGGPDNTRLNHAVKWLFEKVLAVNCIFDVRWTWPHQAESCSQVTVWEGTGCQLHIWCWLDLTTPGWIMQSSDCLRRYWLSTAYLMLDGPDNTRLNHAVKWLFDNVLAVNCIFDVRWTWPHLTESCSQVTVWEGTGCQLHIWCQMDLSVTWPHQTESCSQVTVW